MAKKLLVFCLLVALSLNIVAIPASADGYDYSSKGWNNPLSNMWISSRIAHFNDPGYADEHKNNHAGADFINTEMKYKAAPVYAISDGIVYYVSRDTKSTGNISVIFIRHKIGKFTIVYGHTYADSGIKKGTEVKQGQKIGETRKFNVYHLHFGVNMRRDIPTTGWGHTSLGVNPTTKDWVNPEKWLSSNSNGKSFLIYTYNDKKTGTSYALYAAQMSWSDAKAFAKSKGGYLASINNESEQKIVSDLVSKFGGACWLGGYKKSGKWTWVSGEKFTYTNWAKGEPSGSYNGSDENYIGIYGNSTISKYAQDKHWNDFREKTTTIEGFVVEYH